MPGDKSRSTGGRRSPLYKLVLPWVERVGMTLLPNEREIPLSVSAITLTTHRLRLVSSQRGPFRIVSMMLDELASCAAVKREVPLLLTLAAVIAGLGIAMSIFGQNVGPAAAIVGLLVGGLIAILYLATRHTVLVFASGGGSKIEISTGHMDPGMIVELIDTIEQAKDQRARSLATGTPKDAPAARNSGQAIRHANEAHPRARGRQCPTPLPGGASLITSTWTSTDRSQDR